MANLQELIITTDLPGATESFVGGPSNLPANISWPTDKEGNACMHLLTFPLSIVMPGSNKYAAAFIPYHDRKYYKQISSLPACNYSSILLYSHPGPSRNEYKDKEVESLPRKMVVVSRDIADTPQNYSSKIFNSPAWLQEEIIFASHSCRFALYGADLSVSFKETRGLFSDGMVYIFIKDKLDHLEDGAALGKVFFQL